MKVSELIERLKESRQDAEVMITLFEEEAKLWTLDSIDYILRETLDTEKTKIINKDGEQVKYVVAFCPYDIDTFDRLNYSLPEK